MSHRHPNIVMSLNSDPSVGSTPTPALGATGFTIALSPPVALDPTRHWAAQLAAAQIPYTVTNVSALQGNNKFIYDLLDAAGSVLATRTLTITDGLYGSDDMSVALTSLAVQAGDFPDISPAPPQALFNVIGIQATNRIIFQVTSPPASAAFPAAAGWRIHTGTQPPSAGATPFSALMGFGAGTFLTSLTPPDDFQAPNTADFPNGITGLALHCSLVSGSYSAAGIAGDTLSPIPLNGAPGSFLEIEPKIPISVPVGVKTFSTVTSYLTDQNGRFVPSLQGQSYNYTLQLVDLGDARGVAEDRARVLKEGLILKR